MAALLFSKNDENSRTAEKRLSMMKRTCHKDV